MAHTSPAGDEVQLAAGHVGATVAHLERRIHARFGERETVSTIETLITQLSNKIWQKISLLPRT